MAAATWIIASIIEAPDCDTETVLATTRVTTRAAASRWMKANLARYDHTSDHYCFAYATEYETDGAYGDDVVAGEGRFNLGDDATEWWRR